MKYSRHILAGPLLGLCLAGVALAGSATASAPTASTVAAHPLSAPSHSVQSAVEKPMTDLSVNKPHAILGCGSGYACIYSGSNLSPDYSFYYYGAYNIQNEYGYKAVCNEQTGGALVRLYSGSNGTGTLLATVGPNGGVPPCPQYDLTPVNSVVLSAN